MDTVPGGLERLLATWEVLPPELGRLRAVHASALNRQVACHCAELLARREGPLSERLWQRHDQINGSCWTTPELAYAHYVTLPGGGMDAGELGALVEQLDEVASTPAPPLRVGLPGPAPGWADHALRVFEGDQRRDGHPPPRLGLIDARRDREVLLEGLGVLRQAWPEMAAAADCLVRVALWFKPFRGSATLPQAYGAVFCSTGRDTAGAIEAIVHETTHLELIARTAVDKLVLNGRETGVSPFRQRPRPLTRVVHAALVAKRVAHAMERCASHLDGRQRAAAEAHQTASLRGLTTALDSLAANAKWTDLGAQLFASLQPDHCPAAPAAAS